MAVAWTSATTVASNTMEWTPLTWGSTTTTNFHVRETGRKIMATLTMEQFDALTEGARIVIGDDLDYPYRKVDSEWFTTPNGERIRAVHFAGAVNGNSVRSFDESMPRRWGVRYGTTFWTVPLAERPDGSWDTLTFETSDPVLMHQPGIYACPVSQFGSNIPESGDIPWESMFKALAAHVEETAKAESAALAAKDVEIEGLRERLERSVEVSRLLQEQFNETNQFRDALKSFLSAEPIEGTPLTEWDGIKVGDVIDRDQVKYQSLPLGSVVYHRAGSYWWKRDDTEWMQRGGGATSRSMACNTVVSIGDGMPADPGTVLA